MSFGPYLAGTWESRFGVGTVIQVINPMTYQLNVHIAFLDDNEEFLKCMVRELSANDLLEIIVPELKLKAKFGVVKILSLADGKIKEGIVGYQRQILATAFEKDVEIAFSEAPLAAIPSIEHAEKELDRFKDKCP